MIKCVCFDLDNTLYPEASYYEACYTEIARSISPSECNYIKELMMEIRQTEGDSRVFQRIIDICQLESEYLNKFIEIYRTHQADISLFPDVKAYFNSKNPRFKYGILTNGGEATQKNKINCLKVWDAFDFIIVTGAYLPREEWKPHKSAFGLIQRFTELKACECVYVGDSIKNDMLGAISAGMHAVLIDRAADFQNQKTASYRIINSFMQINDVINEIEKCDEKN